MPKIKYSRNENIQKTQNNKQKLGRRSNKKGGTWAFVKLVNLNKVIKILKYVKV